MDLERISILQSDIQIKKYLTNFWRAREAVEKLELVMISFFYNTWLKLKIVGVDFYGTQRCYCRVNNFMLFKCLYIALIARRSTYVIFHYLKGIIIVNILH